MDLLHTCAYMCADTGILAPFFDLDPAVTAASAPALRRILTPLVDPATFDFWVQKINPVWSWDRVLARVVQVRRASEDATSLVLQPNHHFRGFAAGQHLNVSAQVAGRRTTRSYSFTRPPAADGRLHITVKQVDGGRLSQHLCTQTRVGDVLVTAGGALLVGGGAPPEYYVASSGSFKRPDGYASAVTARRRIAPTAKLAAEARAAWIGRALVVSDRPSSSRAWAPSAC